MTERDWVVFVSICLTAGCVGSLIHFIGMSGLRWVGRQAEKVNRRLMEDRDRMDAIYRANKDSFDRLHDILRRIQNANVPPAKEDLPWAEPIVEKTVPLPIIHGDFSWLMATPIICQLCGLPMGEEFGSTHDECHNREQW